MPLVRVPARHVQLVLSSFLLCVLAQGPGSLDGAPNAQKEYTQYATLLHKELLETRTYNALVPPTSNRITTDSEAGTDVQVQLRIFKVDSLDQSAGHLTMKCWLRLWWYDLRLVWDPEDFGGITEVQFKEGQLWQPDVQPYNVRESVASTFDKNLIRVRSNGELFWSRPGLLELMCKFSGMIMFPFDTLSCLTEFGGWTMGGVVQGVLHRPGPCLQPASGGSVEGTQGSSYAEFSIIAVECSNTTYYYEETGYITPYYLPPAAYSLPAYYSLLGT